MATQFNHMSGSLGPIILYVRNGKQCVRSKGKVSQTEATKKSSSNFSLASKLSAAIKRAMPLLYKTPDGSRHSRASGLFSTWLKGGDIKSKPSAAIELLKAFPINSGKAFTGKWNDNISINLENNLLKIKISELIPSRMMTIPRGTTLLRLHIASASITVEGMKIVKAAGSFDMVPGKSFAATEFVHAVAALPGSIVLTGMAIECFDDHLEPVKWRKGYNAPAWFGFSAWLEM